MIEDYDSDTNNNNTTHHNHDDESIIPMSHNWEHSNKDKHLTDFMTTKHSNALQVKEQDHDDTTEVLDIVQNDHSFTVKVMVCQESNDQKFGQM